MAHGWRTEVTDAWLLLLLHWGYPPCKGETQPQCPHWIFYPLDSVFPGLLRQNRTGESLLASLNEGPGVFCMLPRWKLRGNAFLLSSDGQPHCIPHTQPQLLLFASLLMDAGADVTQIVLVVAETCCWLPKKGKPDAFLVPVPTRSLTGCEHFRFSTHTNPFPFAMSQGAEALIHLLD